MAWVVCFAAATVLNAQTANAAENASPNVVIIFIDESIVNAAAGIEVVLVVV